MALDSPSHFRHLLSLPEEILLHTFTYLDSPSLYNATLVCHHFRQLAEPNLYREIKVLDGEQGSALSYSLRKDVRRCSHIRYFLVSTKLGHENGLILLPPFLARMRNLTHLRLETPDCNSKEPEERFDWVHLQDRYERIFEQSSALAPSSAALTLPNLKACTLHFVDLNTELYALPRYAILFLHPNLEHLTISCTSTGFPENFPEPFRKNRSISKSTRLEELHLEECDIFSPTLSMLLRFPRGLKRLKISEGIRYDGLFSGRNSRVHGNVRPDEFINALAQHCTDTLEFLSLNLGYFRHHGQHINQPGQHLNLTHFHNLQYLELSNNTLDLVLLHPDCDHQTYRRLPPNLQILKIFEIPLGRRPPFTAFRIAYIPIDPCLVRDKSKHGIPQLTTLILAYEHYDRDVEPLRVTSEDGEVQRIDQVELAQSRLVEACTLLLPIFVKADVRLEVRMVELPNGYIPPYLYPEESPFSYVYWDSEREVEEAKRRGGGVEQAVSGG